MRNTDSRQTTTVVSCPWCYDTVPVTVNVGFTNHHRPGGKRATEVTVRRTAAVEHACIDPTMAHR